MGGYCFLNNAAIATQAFLDQGARRVAILDVDYHHGNGTQDIFYRRDDVLFASIHGDPRVEYPYFLGYADERGEGAGEGCNHNYPLAHGSGWDLWSAALDDACVRIAGYAPDALVISLGVDTYKEDPISQFRLDSPDYLRMGERIARLGLPTLFIMEGGYAVEAIGINAVNVLPVSYTHLDVYKRQTNYRSVEPIIRDGEKVLAGVRFKQDKTCRAFRPIQPGDHGVKLVQRFDLRAQLPKLLAEIRAQCEHAAARESSERTAVLLLSRRNKQMCIRDSTWRVETLLG